MRSTWSSLETRPTRNAIIRSARRPLLLFGVAFGEPLDDFAEFLNFATQLLHLFRQFAVFGRTIVAGARVRDLLFHLRRLPRQILRHVDQTGGSQMFGRFRKMLQALTRQA